MLTINSVRLWPRYSRDIAEIQPRYSRDIARLRARGEPRPDHSCYSPARGGLTRERCGNRPRTWSASRPTFRLPFGARSSPSRARSPGSSRARCSSRPSRRAEMRPRCSRDAAEMRPRCRRDAGEMRPRCNSRDTPGCSRDVAETERARHQVGAEVGEVSVERARKADLNREQDVI